MRSRTKSIVNVREYFRKEGGYHPNSDDETDDENWMAIAIASSVSKQEKMKAPTTNEPSSPLKKPTVNYFGTSSLQDWIQQSHTRRRRHRRTSSSESDSFRSSGDTSMSWDITSDEEEEDIETPIESREHRCSHHRRISFDDEVNIVEIPSRASYDESYKQRVWYSEQEFSQMRLDG